MPDASTDSLRRESPTILVGCAGLPAGLSRPAYFRNLDLLEVDATLTQPPRDTVLARWRQEAPPEAAFSALAWQLITHDASAPTYARLAPPLSEEARARVGSFRDSDEVRAAWQRTLAAARALGAGVILFQTPASFTPVEENRVALRRFFTAAAAEAPDLVLAWEPRGVWSTAAAGALAREAGVVHALDPLELEGPPPEGPLAYFRVYGLGVYGHRLSDDALERIVKAAQGYQRTWIVFASTDKYADARHLRGRLEYDPGE